MTNHISSMKTIIFLISFILVLSKINAQTFCFYDPNTGPIYSNGSSGAIYDATSRDFNSDGHLDIVTANSVGSNISFIPGYGNGTLGTADTISVPGTLFCITSGDFNSDNKFDVATSNGVNIFVLLGNGDGTFQPYNSYPVASSPSRMYARDINNDNILDIIEVGGNGVFILIGQGNGSFLPSAQVSGLSCTDITIADFDGDSVLDIVSTTIIDWTNSELSFLKGNGNGTFAPSTSVFSMTYPFNFIAGITSEDIDNDAKTDLIVVLSSNSIPRVEIYLGNGNGTFNNPVFYPTFYDPYYVYLADFNNDLIKDIVVQEANGFSILKGNSNGTFDPYQHFSAMSTPNTLVIEDFNEDTKIDVIIPSAYLGSPLIAMNLNCTITGINNIFQNANASINISPNPFNNFTGIQWNPALENVSLSVFNTYGQRVKQIKNISGQTFILFCDNLPCGLYFLRLTHNKKIITTKKLIITD